MPNAQGLTDQRYDNLMHVAKSDLRCEDVKHSFLGNGIHLVQGCGKYASYLLYCKGGCRWVQNPGELAAATMGCPPARIVMRKVNRFTYAFEGCGERQTYRLHGWTWQRDGAGSERTAGTIEVRPKEDDLGALGETEQLDELE